MTDIQQRVACKALIVHAGKVLILREASTYDEGTQGGKYQLPGGRINPGEPFADGLVREVYEETGLAVQMGEPLYVGEWQPVIHGVKNHIVAIFFVCHSDDDTVRLSTEHDAYAWIDPAEYADYVFAKPDDEVVATYLRRTNR